MLKFKWMLTDMECPGVPRKAGPNEVGYDLKLVKIVSQNKVGDNVVSTLFTTGFAVEPPPGYYSILVARSSLGKTPLTMANCVGIIDPSYRGELMVNLRSSNSLFTLSDKPEVQLILMQLPPNVECVLTDELSATDRGTLGFGGFTEKKHSF